MADYHLYILYSPSAGRFYIGSTSDISQRIHYHNSGRSPYTRGRGPWYLVYSESYETRREALTREREIKRWKSSKRMMEELNITMQGIGSSGPVVTG